MSQVRSFDFQEIDKVEGALTNSGPDAEGETAAMGGTDSLPDGENSIQRRLAEAKRKAQELEQQGYQKGYEQGQEEGFEAGLKAMAETKERLDRLFLQLQELPAKVFQDYRNWFVSTVLAVSRKIVGIELSCRPEQLMELIESLFAQAEKDHNFLLYLNPQDLAAVEKHTERINKIKESVGALQIRADPALLHGGCRLESEVQLLDASIESQFAAIEEMLLTKGEPDEHDLAR